MAGSNYDIQQFYALFRGNEKGYGVTTIGPAIDGKVGATCRFVPGIIDAALIGKHLNGEISIGVAPIRQDGQCLFGAIDIDNYEHRWGIARIVERLYRYNLPLVPCYSKSRHLHIFLFCAQAIPAKEMRLLLKQYCALFGCMEKTEIFPKQDTVTSTAKFYSWINLPYYRADSNNCRKMLSSEMKLCSLAAFVQRVLSVRLPFERHQSFLTGMMYGDAPMCVRTSLFLGECPSGRNNLLFNVGVYLQNKYPDEDLFAQLCEANENLSKPLPESEIQNTIVAGFARNTYTYNCQSVSFCNKAFCTKTPYSPAKTAGITFGQLVQFNTEPVMYDWHIRTLEGREVVMRFPTANSFMNQQKFRELAMTMCHVVPYKVKDSEWTDILNKAMATIQIKDMDAADDFTTGSVLQQQIVSYFQNTRVVSVAADVSLGRLYEDTDRQAYLFSPKMLLQYVNLTATSRFSPEEIRLSTIKLGGFIAEGRWYMPLASVGGALDGEGF